ncbi:MAG TPA: hypothetical protein PK079_26035 [Leptospiraceae bacterium]|nr:hypothetical protein [Leptospiraceae bacterium]HMY29972.1 hypothetical protein [Leptospiraceae bacterium]HNE11604.1 hypothetical protein [Leptospiraceae bacterium]HNE56649.1 hypothetical protein [Leptospiraceae bacterium]HNF57849.1 hypothetical protein [Leptospiraceae bacterium]
MADTQYNGTVRHAIQFYGITANIPKSLMAFPGFQYNQSAARISFIVAAGTSWKKGFNTVYSTDPKIQDFNKIFSAANQKADWTKIKTYDMAVNEAQPTNPIAPSPKPTNPIAPNPNPIPPKPNPNIDPLAPAGGQEDPNKKKDDSNIMWFALAGIGAFLFFKGKKGRRRK